MGVDRWRSWYLSWQARVCDVVVPFSHGTVLRSRRFPDVWSFNCIRLERAMSAQAMLAAADEALADASHRFADWVVPMPEEVVEPLRDHGWLVTPLVWMLHDGRPLARVGEELQEVDYDAVRHLREVWHREDFGDHVESSGYHAQARELAEEVGVRVLAASRGGQLVGLAEVLVHDGGAEVSEVYVLPEHRGQGIGQALTTRGIALAAAAADEVWICAERDNRPRRLYGRLGFQVVVETGSAILPSRPADLRSSGDDRLAEH